MVAGLELTLLAFRLAVNVLSEVQTVDTASISGCPMSTFRLSVNEGSHFPEIL